MIASVHEFAALCGGRYSGADNACNGISTDTRSLRPGDIYLALRGPRFDGNEFLGAAAAAGAVAAVVDRPVSQAPLPLILVEDGQQALTQAASNWRAIFKGVVVGVAGSNGKTTVKEMTASILSAAGSCLATRGNLNNHIGVPLTLLRLTQQHRYAVIEIGANNPGEVAALVKVARPDVGLITNAGAEHLEGFGDLDGVARAEGEMVAGLNANGVAVINADDNYAQMWRGMSAARVVSFAIDNAADFRATQMHESLKEAGFHVTYTLVSPQGSHLVRLNVGGRHNVLNSLAAAAAASAAGATPMNIVAGLAAMQPVSGRLQPGRTQQGARLIDDSYNANPSSMRAGIDVIAGLGGRPWLVMGDMGELGEHARDSHVEIGKYARARGVQRVFATGPLSMLAVESFGSGATWYPDAESLARAVNEELSADVSLLVKGSRSNRLERVVAKLTGAAAREVH
ncbi:MAG: UDP-N-acetylmuramoyl-tripeptide--D-alanyl-D-alanine ligase [Pseudomonadota bacterium]